jgi:hypothetical protein
MLYLFKDLANNISKFPNEWNYREGCLVREFSGINGAYRVKITYFCDEPYYIWIGGAKLFPGYIAKFLLWRAGRKWMKYFYTGIQNTMKEEGLPIKEWIDKRNHDLCD